MVKSWMVHPRMMKMLVSLSSRVTPLEASVIGDHL